MYLAQINLPHVTAYLTPSGSLTYSPHAAAEFADPFTAYNAARLAAVDYPSAYPIAVPAY